VYKIFQFTAMVVIVLSLLYSPNRGICQGRRLPAPSGKLVNLKGSVTNVKMVLGRGPGHITLKTRENQEFSIGMGPVPFLLQNGFNLSVGNEVEIQGIQINEELVPPMIVAIEVKNITSRKAIRLRDQPLRPMWCCRKGRVPFN